MADDSRIAQTLQRLEFGPDGLLPAIAQQWDTGEVLMLAWMDAEAVRRTLATGRGTYWSRSAATVLGEGRDVRQHSGGQRGARRLRRRRDPADGRPVRPGVSHRAAFVFRHRTRRAGGGHDRRVRRVPTPSGVTAPTAERRSASSRATAASSPWCGASWSTTRPRSGCIAKLAGDRPGTFLLESAENGQTWSRYSFIGVRSAAMLTDVGGPGAVGGPPPGGPADVTAWRWMPCATPWRPCAPRGPPGLPPLTGGLVGLHRLRRGAALGTPARRQPRRSAACPRWRCCW